MNKVWVLPAVEEWICDRFVKEWNEDNADISTSSPLEADVIWLLSDWRWRHVPHELLRSKKVITSVHHIVPEKFDDWARRDFKGRDEITDVYHVYNERTLQYIRPLTSKPIELIKYWANQKIWHKTGDKHELRKKYGIPQQAYVIGSAQRDTEGNDLVSPKLEKGPDLLADFLAYVHQSNSLLHVLLAGWRRQYIINRLKQSNIPYTYIELPPQIVLNDLYQTLDLYAVTARHEGGPQSLIECGLLDVPMVSTPVGIAEQVLPASAIHRDVQFATPTVPNVKTWELPMGYEPYRKLIQSL